MKIQGNALMIYHPDDSNEIQLFLKKDLDGVENLNDLVAKSGWENPNGLILADITINKQFKITTSFTVDEIK